MRFSLLLQQLILVVWCRLKEFDPFTECLVPDLNIACSNRCEETSLECIVSCDPEDTACYSQCLREIAECVKDCPCELNCLDGCDECDNPVCKCEVTEENPDWNRCIDDNSLKLGRCVYSCENNEECEDDCLSRFKTRQLDCPYIQNDLLIAGCPCSDFECTEPTPAPPAVLVLNTYRSSNKPMIVDFEGNINDDLVFEYGRTNAAFGCGVTFQNEFWYFGGSPSQQQASKIVGCKLERQTDMTFDLYVGACNTFSDPNPIVLLCFDSNNNQECRTFDGMVYKPAGNSSYAHANTYGMANYKGKALTTGCDKSSDCSVKTELMNMNSLTWSVGPDYPFGSKIARYSTASTSEAAYIIGGSSTKEIVAEFKKDRWHQFGTLKKGRSLHGSITLDDEFMVIGGDGSSDLVTEVWNRNNGNDESLPDYFHYAINPVLASGDYSVGLGLYVVPFDFCTS